MINFYNINNSLVRIPNSNDEDDNDDRNNNGNKYNNNNNNYDSDNDSDKRYEVGSCHTESQTSSWHVVLINCWVMWYAASYKIHLFIHHLLLSYRVTCGHVGQKTNIG